MSHEIFMMVSDKCTSEYFTFH